MKSFIFFVVVLSVLTTSCSKESGGDPQPTGTTITPTSISVSAKATEVVIDIVSDDAWRITPPRYGYWYTISPLRGSGNGQVKLSFHENKDMVDRNGNIIITVRDKQISLPISQVAGGGDGNYADKDVRVFSKSRSGKAANLLFLGDGFIKEDMVYGGAFDKAVEEAVNGWFAVEPFKSYKEYFNIYTMGAISAERGATYEDVGVIRNTVFSVTYTGNGSNMTVNEDKVNEYISTLCRDVNISNIDDLEVIMIVNDSRYGGTTYMWSMGPSIALCPMNRHSELPGGFVNILVHEAGGHGFGHLADEYYFVDEMVPDEAKENIELFQSYNMYMNIAVASDKTKVSWSPFVGVSGYEEVSVFEGAFMYTKGVWRSEYLSCMENNCQYFNVASRKAIVERLKSMVGESFSMSEFIQKDVQKHYPFDKGGLTKRDMLDAALPPLAPPVVKIVR